MTTTRSLFRAAVLAAACALPCRAATAFQLYQAGRYDQALSAAREGEKRGSAEDLLILGFLHLEGRGVPKDAGKAVSYHERAADAGSVDAAIRLGEFYRQGTGFLKKDSERFQHWYKVAAKHARPLAGTGDTAQMVNLGIFHEEGWGVPKDREKAAYWYKKAANLGVPAGMYGIGELYAKGWGVKKSRVNAAMWMILARDAGYPGADRYLAGLSKKMSKRQLDYALSKARTRARIIKKGLQAR